MLSSRRNRITSVSRNTSPSFTSVGDIFYIVYKVFLNYSVVALDTLLPYSRIYTHLQYGCKFCSTAVHFALPLSLIFHSQVLISRLVISYLAILGICKSPQINNPLRAPSHRNLHVSISPTSYTLARIKRTFPFPFPPFILIDIPI